MARNRSSCCRCAGMGRVAIDRSSASVHPVLKPKCFLKRSGKSVGSKMLNRQFCATTSTEVSGTVGQRHRLRESRQNWGRHQGLSLAAIWRLRAAASHGSNRIDGNHHQHGGKNRQIAISTAANTYVQDSGCFRVSAGWWYRSRSSSPCIWQGILSPGSCRDCWTQHRPTCGVSATSL